jgi:hypothetical protein
MSPLDVKQQMAGIHCSSINLQMQRIYQQMIDARGMGTK